MLCKFASMKHIPLVYCTAVAVLTEFDFKY